VIEDPLATTTLTLTGIEDSDTREERIELFWFGQGVAVRCSSTPACPRGLGRQQPRRRMGRRKLRAGRVRPHAMYPRGPRSWPKGRRRPGEARMRNAFRILESRSHQTESRVSREVVRTQAWGLIGGPLRSLAARTSQMGQGGSWRARLRSRNGARSP